jgi:hypothetical protein
MVDPITKRKIIAWEILPNGCMTGTLEGGVNILTAPIIRAKCNDDFSWDVTTMTRIHYLLPTKGHDYYDRQLNMLWGRENPFSAFIAHQLYIHRISGKN